MKAISLWQPWASAVALGTKRVETRSWSTGYRGPLAIHAAKTRHGVDIATFSEHGGPDCPGLYAVWKKALSVPPTVRLQDWFCTMPYGAIVAVCRLADVREVEDVLESGAVGRSGFEFALGNYSAGRFAWMLDRVQPLAQSIPFRGRQQLFDVPDELLAAQGVATP